MSFLQLLNPKLVPTDTDPAATYTETETRQRLRQLITVLVVDSLQAPAIYGRALGSLVDRLSDRQISEAVKHLAGVQHFLATGETPEQTETPR